jgi:flagellar motility protein MotE (MotC chaperone)
VKIRLIPTVVIAAGALCVLKLAGIAVDGGYVLSPVQTAVTQQSATEGKPAGKKADEAKNPPPSGNGVLPPSFASDGAASSAGLEIGGSSAERKVLESLSGRRRELDDREKKSELREQLLKATEDRLDEQLKTLRETEARIKAVQSEKKAKEQQKLKDLIVMYESMKAKDAARIFDRLGLDISIKVASGMKPRKMADVLAKMSPDAAQRLTVALANGQGPSPEEPAVSSELPKIQGN